MAAWEVLLDMKSCTLLVNQVNNCCMKNATRKLKKKLILKLAEGHNPK